MSGPLSWIQHKWINRHVPSAQRQIDTLADFILREAPEEVRGESAVEIAIRIIGEHKKCHQNDDGEIPA